jgi:hypothetical protein
MILVQERKLPPPPPLHVVSVTRVKLACVASEAVALLPATTPQSTYFTVRGQSYFSRSKILTPHPPLRPASLSSPRNKGGGHTLAGRRGGWGVNILEDERNRILPLTVKYVLCGLH